MIIYKLVYEVDEIFAWKLYCYFAENPEHGFTFHTEFDFCLS